MFDKALADIEHMTPDRLGKPSPVLLNEKIARNKEDKRYLKQPKWWSEPHVSTSHQ